MFFLGYDSMTVNPANPYSFAAQLLNQTYNFLINSAYQYHLGYIHGIFVCHSQAINKLWFSAVFFDPVIDCRTTTVHNDRINANIFHQHNIRNHFFFYCIIIHRMSTVFNYDGFTGKFFDIWQSFYQHFCCFHCFFQILSSHFRYPFDF